MFLVKCGAESQLPRPKPLKLLWFKGWDAACGHRGSELPWHSPVPFLAIPFASRGRTTVSRVSKWHRRSPKPPFPLAASAAAAAVTQAPPSPQVSAVALVTEPKFIQSRVYLYRALQAGSCPVLFPAGLAGARRRSFWVLSAWRDRLFEQRSRQKGHQLSFWLYRGHPLLTAWLSWWEGLATSPQAVAKPVLAPAHPRVCSPVSPDRAQQSWVRVQPGSRAAPDFAALLCGGLCAGSPGRGTARGRGQGQAALKPQNWARQEPRPCRKRHEQLG